MRIRREESETLKEVEIISRWHVRTAGYDVGPPKGRLGARDIMYWGYATGATEQEAIDRCVEQITQKDILTRHEITMDDIVLVVKFVQTYKSPPGVTVRIDEPYYDIR